MSFFQFYSQLEWHPPCRHIMKLQNIMEDMACCSMTHIQMCGYFIHCYVAIFLHDGFNCCNGLSCYYSVCPTSRGESLTELMPFMNFPVYSYSCCSDRHASPYWTFIDEFWWVSPLHYLKNGWKNAVLLWCMMQAGPPSLHYYCTVMSHSCIILPPVGHFSNHEYHCCQLTRQSSRVSNFYRTFKVFIWLSLVIMKFFLTTFQFTWWKGICRYDFHLLQTCTVQILRCLGVPWITMNLRAI